MEFLRRILTRFPRRQRIMSDTTEAQGSPAVVVYGAITLENIVRLPVLPKPERSASVTADYYKAGGEALNLALPLATWGHRVAVAGNRLGEDAYADAIFVELKRYPQIETRWIEREQKVRTPFNRVLVTASGQDHTINYWRDDVPYTQPHHAMLHGAKVLCTDGYVRYYHNGVDPRINATRIAKELGITIVATDVINPDQPLLHLCDWVITSRSFLTRALDVNDAVAYIQKLHERHKATYLLTDGKNPVCVMTKEGVWLEVPPYGLSALDRLNAGEVFKAGIVHGILNELELMETVRFASAAAAIWVAQPSAYKRPPTLAQIAALQEERGAVHPEPTDDADVECPICHREVRRALFEKHWTLDKRVVSLLRQQNPAWQRVMGACPTCVHAAVKQIGLTRATVDVPSSLAEHPIYGQGEPQALPIGVRLRANPHYAGRGITIASLDSGFYPHPDLTRPNNRILECVDATTSDIVVGADFSTPALTSWHGMMTSVVAAGNGYLSDGYYSGLASAANLVLVKVSDPRMHINEVDILRGLTWLAEHWRDYNVKVVNLSVGGDDGLRPDAPLNQLVNRLVEEGVVVVAAAGNMGRNDLVPPASAEWAITVGGVDDQNSLDPNTDRMWHSNWGRISHHVLKPELIAPSIWLAAPVLPGTPTAEQNLILDALWRVPLTELPERLQERYQDLGFDPSVLQGPPEDQRDAVLRKLMANKYISPFYQHVDGTSFAAPIVSGVVAQMLEANPNLTPKRVKELLVATARPLMGVSEDRQGYGVVRPGQAVAAALRELYGQYHPGELSPQVNGDTVRFIFHEPRAKQVSVVGAWNEWEPDRLPMEEKEAGVWVAELPRPATGRYDYKFAVNDAQWLDDPENLEKTVDGYGGFNSVLVV